MSEKLKYFSLAGVAVLASIFIFAAAFKGLVYIKDYVKSFFITTFSLYESPGGGITIIRAGNYGQYLKPYRSMPEGYFHFANMLFYKSGKNTGVNDFALATIELTDYYKLYRLKQDILTKNRVSKGIINSGELVLISNSLPPYVTDITASRSGNIRFTKGLYFSGDSAGGESFLAKLPSFRAAGINAIVFDVKDVTGIVHIKSKVKEAVDFGLSKQGAIDNLPKLLRTLRENGMYIIARIAVFRDHLLWTSDPSARIKSKSSGREWNHGSHELWCDPSNNKVQDYNIALAVELAKAGVDEVQFDYIRFPTNGDQKDIDYSLNGKKGGRVEIITAFLEKAHREINRAGAFFSLDVFGVVAWSKDIDINATGQRIDLLAGHCDVLSPMLYPSHFNDNFDGYRNPGDHPYYFITAGCRKMIELSKGKAIIRPWLQAFAWRVSRFNAYYISEQVKASNDSGAYGYLFWNASNKYSEVIQSMTGGR
jgi:hypothetical protein